MKLLYTNFHPGSGGGHTTYILSLFRSLRHKHQIQIACPSTSALNQYLRRLDPDSVLDIDYPGKFKELPGIVRNQIHLRRLLQKGAYDMIHVNGSPDHRLVARAIRGLRVKPAIVYTKHNSFPVKRNCFSMNRFRRHTDHIIVTCRHQADMFEQIGVPKESLTWIKNGVDTSHYTPWSDSKRREIRAYLGLSSHDLVLTSVAGTDLHKGWQTLIAAVSRMGDSTIKIIVCGHTPSHDTLAQHVNAYGMQKQVMFPGLVEDVRPFIAACDVGFVLSSGVETISFACAEMMAMAKPVIVSDFACLPDNVTHGESGWVVETGDVASLNSLLRKIRPSRGLLAGMGHAARLRAVAESSLEIFAQHTDQVYLRVLSRKSLSF